VKKSLLTLKLVIPLAFLTLLPAQLYAVTAGQVFNKVKESVIVVKTLDRADEEQGFGSGVLLPSGKIATNCHVVEGGATYQVGWGEQFVPATLYAEDHDKDICLLDAKVVSRKPAELGKAATLKVGDRVYAVGAPLGLELSISQGIVSQLRGGLPPMIQTTAAISPGSSGGGLFDKKGRLVGLTTLNVVEGQNLNFAIPVEWIDEVKPGRREVSGIYSHSEWTMRVSALWHMENFNKLLKLCHAWTKDEPDNKLAWYSLGAAYGQINRYQDAVEAYRNALLVDPQFAFAWSNLGLAYAELKLYDHAIKSLQEALRIDPEHNFAWANLGFVYVELHRYNAAIMASRQALRIDLGIAEPWNNLGLAYAGLKRHNNAIEAYRQAIRINPEFAVAWYNLGVTYELSGNKGAAMDALKELRRLDPALADKFFDFLVPR